MYPIFIYRRRLLCNVLYLKTTYMAIKPRVFKAVFKEIPPAQVHNMDR